MPQSLLIASRIGIALAIAAVLSGGSWFLFIRQKPETPKLALPAIIKIAPGELFTIKADTVCETVVWSIPTGVQAKSSGVELYGSILTAGSYRVFCAAAYSGTPLLSSCEIVVGTDPNPPTPGPPAPNPPTPDALTNDLQDIYTSKETDQNKAMNIVPYRALFVIIAKMVDDKGIATGDMMLKLLQSTAEVTVPSKALPVMRERVAKELDDAIPLDLDSVMGDPERAKLKAALQRIAAALAKVK